jgi:hypothetical protein
MHPGRELSDFVDEPTTADRIRSAKTPNGYGHLS